MNAKTKDLDLKRKKYLHTILSNGLLSIEINVIKCASAKRMLNLQFCGWQN